MRLKGKKHHWYGADHSRDKNAHWKGGKYINDSGYVMVYDPEHPRSSSNGYVREHILIAEKAIGKELPSNSQIHHLKSSSDNGSLVICEDQKYHYLIHIRQLSLKECGDANKRKCSFCKEYDFPENLYLKQRPNGVGWSCYHPECQKNYSRNRRKNKK